METVHEGWLKVSSSERKLFRNHKWDQRWFVLKQSGNIPGQYVMEYYSNSTYKKLKGKIDLDQCKQIDVTHDSNKPDENFFTIRTYKRLYYLFSTKSLDLNKWIQCLCTVCNFKAIQETDNEMNNSISIKTSKTCKNNNSLTVISYANPNSLYKTSHTDQNLIVNQSENDSSSILNNKKHRLWNNNNSKLNNHSLIKSNSKLSQTVLSNTDKNSNLKSAYIPISECHTGQSIFKTDSIDINETKYLESNKENEKKSLLDTSCSSSFNNSINYNVPKHINTFKKSKIEDLLNIVPSPPHEEESLYANSKYFPQNLINSSFNSHNNNIDIINTECLSKDFEKNSNQKQYYNNLESIHLLSPPPRPPKPLTLSIGNKSSSLTSFTNNNSSKLSPTLINLMYSIPKSQVELQLEKEANIKNHNKNLTNELDQIVPLISNNKFSNLRSYTNAPSSENNIFKTYDYDKPNLPITNSNEFLINCKLKQDNDKQENDNLVSSLNTSFKTQLPTTVAKNEKSITEDKKSSVLQILDVFGPPLVNRNTKPRKNEFNLQDKYFINSTHNQINDNLIINQKIINPKSIPPRIPPRGRQFFNKDLLNNDQLVFTYDEFFNTNLNKNKINSIYTEIQYLDLDLENDNLSVNSSSNETFNSNYKEVDNNNLINSNSICLKSLSTNNNLNFNNQFNNFSNNTNTVYKTVDFIKTKAFNELRDGLNRKTPN